MGDQGSTEVDDGSSSALGGRDLRTVAVAVKGRLTDDHVSLSAAGVAFFAFLSLVPAMASVVFVYALFIEPEQVEERMESLLGSVPEEARILLTDQLASIVDQAGGALTVSLAVSIVLSVWSASSAMAHLIEAVNLAHRDDDQRTFLTRRGVALALTVGGIALLGVAVAVIAVLPRVLGALDLPAGVRQLLAAAAWPPLILFMALGLAVLYRVAPRRVAERWRWMSWGAVIAAVLWALGSIAFELYVASFSSYNETYGSLAAVIVLLLWIYLSAFVVLLGAEIDAELDGAPGAPTETPHGDEGEG